jgi:ATP-binding protein involved in chromosome partitioning
MAFSKEHVIEALRTIRDAKSGRDLVELDAVRKCAACDGFVTLMLGVTENSVLRQQLREGVEAAIRRRADDMGEAIKSITIEFIAPAPGATNSVGVGIGVEGKPVTVEQPASIPLKQASSSPTVSQGTAKAGSASMPGVKHIIAVGAGKGGVGKSTVSVNLAVGLARQGHRVGILDGDIYGPSLPTLLALTPLDVTLRGNMLQPFLVHGVKAMTIGKLVDADKPLIWRGPMAHGAFKQLVEQTEWGELDYLIIDLPPGTGDVSLTMAQMMRLTGAVIVCTPQKVAQDDAVRAAAMFRQLNIPVMGIVENMSYFIGDEGKEYDIFGRGGAEMMAQRLGLPFLGAVPINMALRANSDSGDPTANFTGSPKLSSPLENLVRQVETQAAIEVMRSGTGPQLVVT